MSFGFQLTAEQEAYRKSVAEFSARYIAPKAREMDSSDTLPKGIWKEFGNQGYPAMPIPKKYGGTERSVLEQAIMMEEVTANGHAPVVIALLEAAALCSGAVLIGGNEKQKSTWLPEVAKGNINSAFALTEPGVGSDPANMHTTAVRDGDGYVLNGAKRYVSFAGISDFVMVFAKTDPSAGAKGVTAFMVETSRPGFKIVDAIPCIGLRGHQDEEVELHDVRVPLFNRVGEEGQGLKIALQTLDKTRTTLCGGFIGLARASLDAAVWYGQNRLSFGKPLGEYQALRFPMAEAEMKIEAARWLTWKACWTADQGKPHSLETAHAKLAASQAMLFAADTAFTVYGGFGGTQKYTVERYYRDAKIWSFAQGSPEIMTEIIARNLLKKQVPEPLI
ncbi:MAG TPA: acyl-CoA dehydrogenase family protein [Bdellovibrionales bacterium]|nr:acyl-CoA dehydrogenase family protein [Bdellovibrionales bacterium]